MSSVDTAWLRMDRPENLMTIVGVLLLDRVPDPARLRALLESRFLAYPRFRQRAVSDLAGSWWEDDPDFRIDRHLVRRRLRGARGPAQLKACVAALAATPLPPEHPRWEMTLIDNYAGGAALVARVHHAYADGIALIGVMLSLTDREEGVPVPAAAPAKTPRAGRPAAPPADDPTSALQQWLAPAAEALQIAARKSNLLLSRGAELLRNPVEAIDYARIGAAVATEIGHLATMPDDSRTRFKGRPGIAKRVAWTEPLSLDDVKAVGQAFACSVNDVLLACVAGALRGYLAARGDATEGVELRALVPVNLRAPGKESRLGNRFGLVALELPVGIANPLARVHAVRRRMAALKSSYQAPVTLGLLGLVGLCPQPVQARILDLLASKATAVMTNVPGPREPLWIAGARLDNMMFWVPQSGDIGMGVSVLSYNGSVQFGLITDAGIVPDPDAIVAGFAPEFDRLLWAALMEPWDGARDPGLVDEEIAAAEAALDPTPPPPRTTRSARRRQPKQAETTTGTASA
jgi:WS/DGAT/MGAT family acyltransferase